MELLIDRVLVANGEVEIGYVVPTHPRSENIRLRKGYFHQVVQVLAGSNLDATRKFAVCLHLSHRPVRGRIGVQCDLRGQASALHRAAQKRFGGVYVPVPAEKEIDCLARFVDGAVQVQPLSVNLYIVSSILHDPPTGRA